MTRITSGEWPRARLPSKIAARFEDLLPGHDDGDQGREQILHGFGVLGHALHFGRQRPGDVIGQEGCTLALRIRPEQVRLSSSGYGKIIDLVAREGTDSMRAAIRLLCDEYLP